MLLLAVMSFAQSTGFDIYGTSTNPYTGPYGLVTLDTLAEAKTLSDIHARYPASWVARYLSVELSSDCDGSIKKAVGKDDTLTPAQLSILRTAGMGCKIDVAVAYIPENKLKDNPPRDMQFSLLMAPIHEATYPGGVDQLEAYLKENTVDKISETTFKEIELTKARFKVDMQGQITDVRMIETSRDDKIDQLILNAICNMPAWRPAKNSQGVSIIQEFEFVMGTLLLYNCYRLY